MSKHIRSRGRVSATLVALGLVAVFGLAGAADARAQGGRSVGVARIEGRVVGPGNQPLQNARVQLLNDGYSPVGRTQYTDGSGRFRYTAPAGAYYVDVDPVGMPYERKQERFDLNASPFSRTGEVFFIEIVLKPLERRDAAPSATGVRFVQEVPAQAREEFERGKQLLKDNPDEAYAAMRRALQIYQDYYEALETLGSEYVRKGYFDHALPILLHAVEVNPDGEGSYYALGVLFFQQKHYPNAVKAFRRVLRTSPTSTNGTIYLGLSLFRAGEKTEAEDMLKRARQMGAEGVPDVNLALAQVYIESKRYNEAVVELEALLRENPNYPDRQKIEGLIGSLKKKAA